MSAATMPAGRAMNALVAEKVFGATIHEGQHDDYMTLPGERPVSDQRPVPDFSGDIAAAWPVVEKLRGLGFSRVEIHSVEDIAVCQIEKGSGTVDEAYLAQAEAVTAPLAICRAALAAMESLS